MAGVPSPRIPAGDRYQGPIACPSAWCGVSKDGTANPAMEIRVLTGHPDGGYLYEWVHQGDAKRRCGKQLGHAPEENLRRIFRPIEPLPVHAGGGAQEGIRRIAIREATEEEALAYGRFGDSAISRFLIVDADEPENTLQYGGNLGRGEGSDWILYAIRQARRWERKGYKLVLTPEQEMIEAVGKLLDLSTWFPPMEIARDPASAVAKFDRVCRIVCPEAFLSEGRADRVRRRRAEEQRRAEVDERKEAEKGEKAGADA